jgi:hypothetical protein
MCSEEWGVFVHEHCGNTVEPLLTDLLDAIPKSQAKSSEEGKELHGTLSARRSDGEMGRVHYNHAKLKSDQGRGKLAVLPCLLYPLGILFRNPFLGAACRNHANAAKGFAGNGVGLCLSLAAVNPGQRH